MVAMETESAVPESHAPASIQDDVGSKVESLRRENEGLRGQLEDVQRALASDTAQDGGGAPPSHATPEEQGAAAVPPPDAKPSVPSIASDVSSTSVASAAAGTLPAHPSRGGRAQPLAEGSHDEARELEAYIADYKNKTVPTIFEDADDEIEFLRRRGDVLLRGLLNARKVGRQLQERYDDMYKKYYKAVGDAAFWKEAAEEETEKAKQALAEVASAQPILEKVGKLEDERKRLETINEYLRSEMKEAEAEALRARERSRTPQDADGREEEKERLRPPATPQRVHRDRQCVEEAHALFKEAEGVQRWVREEAELTARKEMDCMAHDVANAQARAENGFRPQDDSARMAKEEAFHFPAFPADLVRGMDLANAEVGNTRMAEAEKFWLDYKDGRAAEATGHGEGSRTAPTPLINPPPAPSSGLASRTTTPLVAPPPGTSIGVALRTPPPPQRLSATGAASPSPWGSRGPPSSVRATTGASTIRKWGTLGGGVQSRPSLEMLGRPTRRVKTASPKAEQPAPEAGGSNVRRGVCRSPQACHSPPTCHTPPPGSSQAVAAPAGGSEAEESEEAFWQRVKQRRYASTIGNAAVGAPPETRRQLF